MSAHLWREQIYEALLDEEAMRQLPELLAKISGARSALLQWWHSDGEAEIVAHNGYFSDADFANYAENFADKDLWSLRGAKTVNVVQNCDDLVSPGEYEHTEFYNEWIRAIGDDTFHCAGTCIHTGWGMGFVGLHRGKSQGSFALEQTDALGPIIVDIRRMLAIRGRLSRAERRAQEASEVFDAIGDAFVTVSSAGRIVHLNASAEALLREADGLTVRHGRLCACAFSADRALLAAIAQAVASDGTASAVPIPRKSGGQFDLTVVPLSSAGQDRRALVTVRDVHACDPSVATRLRQLYRLSSSEAAIAVLLAEGFAPDEIAAQRGAAIGTVRVQVKTVAAKMECRGQREIAAAVNRLIRLYPDRLA